MIMKIAQCGIHDAAQLLALAIKELEIQYGQRCLHRSPPAFGTETFSQPGSWPKGYGASQRARHAMTPLPAGDAFLMVAIMSLTFLTEVALFILIGLI
jgi:hypothetical protein